MGNSGCCPASNPCDHTVDETQGLLNSPDSKVSAKPLTTEGISHAVEVEESQSASPVSIVSKELVDASATPPETKNEDETTEETQTSATEVTDATELAIANVNGETEAHISDSLEKEHTACKPKLMVQDALEEGPADDVIQVNPQQEVDEEDTKKMMSKADENEDYLEKGAGNVETGKEELKTPVEVLPAMEIPQPIEPVLNNSAIDELKVKGLVAEMDMAENTVDTTLPENAIAETPVIVSELSCEEKAGLAVEKPVADEVQQNYEDHAVFGMSEMMENGLPAETQETLAQESSPAMNIIEESTVNYIENGQVEDSADVGLRDENAAELNAEEPQLTEFLVKPPEEPSRIGNQEIVSEASADSKSASIAEVPEKPESDTAEIQMTIPEYEKEGNVGEAFQNGLPTYTPVEKPESIEKPDKQVKENELESESTAPSEASSFDRDLISQPSENDERTAGDEKEDAESNQAQKGEIVFSSGHDMKVALIPVCDLEHIAEKEPEHEDSIEDLYQADNEIEQEQTKEKKSMPLLEFTIPGVEEKCSLAAPVDILAYSEREWKGNTAKSNVIRKGYSEISCSFNGLRRVRGDNYCSLRATLYQVLTTTTQTPAWLQEEDFTSLPEKIEAQEQLVGMWVFPPQCAKAEEKEDPVEKLKHYLELLQIRVEMFLLGYALQHTIQAFRLYKADTEEFVTHYPDDHKQDWPCVCVITEDDRHYNVPVRKPTHYRA
ncbi:fibrous sheath CABYR-binding protein-like [Silurus asotus]|uniref:Fibrous sheath CABYR-binding protein-like n=1 Tax=Silurus asotus TaxID=30991 RepID=A0AAD5AHY7_SILAS|nr:fibrous sheath CABYR-binding protein-like [Silurus asotus]